MVKLFFFFKQVQLIFQLLGILNHGPVDLVLPNRGGHGGGLGLFQLHGLGGGKE